MTEDNYIGRTWLRLVNMHHNYSRQGDMVNRNEIADVILAFEKVFPVETQAESDKWTRNDPT